MSNTQQHMFDQVASMLADWMDATPDRLAEEIRGGGRQPFSAPTTEKQKLDFYASRFFNPDGTENSEGQKQELERLGIKGYAQVYTALRKAGRVPDPKAPAAPAFQGASIPVPMLNQGGPNGLVG